MMSSRDDGDRSAGLQGSSELAMPHDEPIVGQHGNYIE